MKMSLAAAARFLVDLNRDRKFTRIPGAYHGVFKSFAEARSSVPSMKAGFDHPELSHIYDFRRERVFPSDYPVLFRLRDILHESKEVFDFGGHVGISFYAYRKYLSFPTDFTWRVCDVPEIAKSGRELAEASGEGRLSFCTDFAEVDGFGVLLASGSLQFLERPLSDMLREISRRPRHLLLNKLPIYDGEPFVTLQNTIYSVNPYSVSNRSLFVESVLALGYELVDSWENADLSCRIPLHPERCIPWYSGFYFRAP